MRLNILEGGFIQAPIGSKLFLDGNVSGTHERRPFKVTIEVLREQSFKLTPSSINSTLAGSVRQPRAVRPTRQALAAALQRPEWQRRSWRRGRLEGDAID